MQIKIHQAYRIVAVVCDTELLGKTFEEGNKRITLHENFFKGEEKNKEELLEILKDLEKEDATFNIVGKDSVSCAIEAGIVSKNGVIEIQEIPIALGLM